MKFNNKPLVSICIPVYNHEKYVVESIESVINQTYENVELIIIDDGSLDDSKKTIETLIHRCKNRFVRFKFLSRPNKGLSSTLNEALSWCTGYYFSVLASDDIMLPDKTRKQVEIFQDEKYKDKKIAIVSHEIQPLTKFGRKRKIEHSKFQDGTIFDFNAVYYGEARIMAPAVMLLIDVVRDVGGYKDGLAIEDLYMWLAITEKGYRALYFKEVLTNYRLHDDNTAAKAKLMHRAHYEVYKTFSSSSSELKKAMIRPTRIAFQGAVSSDKKYALALIFRREINPLSFRLIPYSIRIFIPSYLLGLLRKMKFSLKK